MADLFVQPYGALLIGSCAGAISVFGFEYITPYLARKFKLHDTCGVHNLHGMPAILASALSIFMAAIATEETYRHGLTEIYPALAEVEDHGHIYPAITQLQQAVNQFLAFVVTMVIAVVGGVITGLIMKGIGRWQALDQMKKPGSTVIILARQIVGAFTEQMGFEKTALAQEDLFDDNLFFEVPE